MILPQALPSYGWWVHNKGYARRTMPIAATPDGKKRLIYAHHAVLALFGYTVAEGYAVHHQDGVKLNNCPYNLVLMPHCLNPVPLRHRHPYTGAWMTVTEWERQFSRSTEPESGMGLDMPDWVRELGVDDGGGGMDDSGVEPGNGEEDN